jgi:hypothetical protein
MMGEGELLCADLTWPTGARALPTVARQASIPWWQGSPSVNAIVSIVETPLNFRRSVPD